MELVLDMALLIGVARVLSRFYGERFRQPISRHDWPDWDMRPSAPPPDPSFRHNDLMPAETEAITNGGVGADVLSAEKLAVLLLNPYALWDLADLILFRMPQWWEEPKCRRGEQHMTAIGFELPMPNPRVVQAPKPTEDPDASGRNESV